ncbi:pentatricopeptide repeat-containing protein At1g62930, chloroplastic-like [Spinacia oleracea]|uniref:Pentatricopeptide repeat-containing protein At1g62930, chloroplastic-like n=1 Tax=Spinacia oleracea TaxID=3562 RepID=A0A9R0K5Y9_SPIOL|nr:pentatricopeptide repeat-containing protein At1g62930, chloroplastic-like [Spinacia oleracea]
MSETADRSDTDNNDKLTFEEELYDSAYTSDSDADNDTGNDADNDGELTIRLYLVEGNWKEKKGNERKNNLSYSILESRDNWDVLLNIDFFCRMITNPPEELSHLNQFKYFNWALSRDDFQINDSLLDGITYILRKDVLTTPNPWHCDKRWLHLSWNLVKSGGGGGGGGGGGVVTKLRNKLIKNLGEEEGNIHGIVSTRILNKLINAFGYYGDHESGIEILNKFPDFYCNPDLNTYSGVVYCAWGCKSEDWELEFCQGIVKYLQESIKIDNRVDDESVCYIIDLYCNLDKPKLGYAIYEVAKQKISTKCLHELIHCLSKHDETLCLAESIAVDLLSCEARKNATSAFSSVILGLCRKGDIERARGIVIRMLLSDPFPEFKAFYHVIKCLCASGNMEDALSLLKHKERLSGGVKPEAYGVIIKGYGRMEQANQMAKTNIVQDVDVDVEKINSHVSVEKIDPLQNLFSS